MNRPLFLILAALCCSVNAAVFGDHYEALDSYRTSVEGYLSFKIGEIITLKSANIGEGPSVWVGELHGVTAKFNASLVRRCMYEVIVDRTTGPNEEPENDNSIYLDLVMGDLVELVERDEVIHGYWLARHNDVRGFIHPSDIMPAVYETRYEFHQETSPEFLKVNYGDLVSVTDKSDSFKGYVMAELNGEEGRVFISSIDKPIYESHYTLNTTNKEDVSFNATERMILFSKSVGGEERSGWWWATALTNSTKNGFVPKVYMKSSTCVVILDCPAEETSELDLVVDDRVQLISDPPGTHWLGVSKTNIGYFPIYCCRFDKSFV